MAENAADNNKRLSESEERFRALVNATSDVVYRMNPDWTVMQQLNGGGFLSDVGEPIDNWMDKYIHPLDRELVQTAIAKAINTQSMFTLEHRVLQADGSLGWTSSKAVPMLDGQGEITEWFGAASDITSRKRMEEALQQARDEAEQQKRLYETVTSNTPDLVYVFDLDYRFSFANPALLNMWGKSWGDAIGKRLIENGYEPWHAEMHEREIDQIVATKQQVRGEVAFPHATLGRRIYDYILAPVINAQGEVEAISGTTRDITEIKENEQRKNSFISMVSHELKTPLTSVISFVQISQRRAVQNNDPVAADMLERAGKQLGKMTRMINSFLNVSRLESSHIQIDHQPFDLSMLMQEVEEEAKATISSHQVVFEPVAGVQINADREKIGQVFNNLISNAVKYSPTGSSIYIAAVEANGTVTVSVKDEGVGISETDLPRLFERYYRVREAELNHISGFGIGLYLCSEIVKRHGGNIWAESRPDKGSVFYFNLPVIEG